MRIPFTKYEIKLKKRSFSMDSNSIIIPYETYLKQKGFIGSTTPLGETVYTTFAKEFAKIDIKHVKVTKNNELTVINDNLSYLLSRRPNPLQTKYDFLFTLIYQLKKYGNALAFLQRDEKGNVIEIDPLDVNDYSFGNGYQFQEDGDIFIKVKVKDKIQFIKYKNIIHLRSNPNDLFYGDKYTNINASKNIIRLFDTSLAKLFDELADNGTLYGVVNVGSSATGFSNRALNNDADKIKKQKELIERIKSTKGGLLVLDAGEEFKQINSPFNTTSSKDIDRYIQYLYEFEGTNQKVCNGTASFQEMEVFFYKEIAPLIEQFIGELEYKIFSERQIAAGNRIEYYRNPFEYIPITEAINVAYKGAQDTTTNERRRLIYKLAPLPGGDKLMYNKNFEEVGKEDEEDANA